MSLYEQMLEMIPLPVVGTPVRTAGYEPSWVQGFDAAAPGNLATKNIWSRETTINNEQQFYTAGGNLAYERNSGQLEIVAGLNPYDLGDQGLPYTSAILSTRGHHSQTYGKFEIEAQLPIGKGIWPAFWMLPEFGQWPAEFGDRTLPEIDIMEYIGDDPSRYYSTLHYYANEISQRDNYTHVCPEHDLTAEKHRYGLEWTPKFMAWYFDGVYRKVILTPEYFHVPFHMILNMAIGGNWPGEPDLPEDVATVRFKISDWFAEQQVQLEDHPNYDILKRMLAIKQASSDCHYLSDLDKYINELLA